jgi:predicted 3-demethylubiquinone-9 3-methyltransferase (glyoxalase superfamily)
MTNVQRQGEQNMSKITPFLWFNDNKAEEAVDFYLSVFKSGKKQEAVMSDLPPFAKGVPITIPFQILGTDFVAFNGTGARFDFNESISFWVNCANQEEIDYYWSALLAGGGSEMACGWLKDQYGIRWQIVPAKISEYIKTPGGMQAMLGMIKLDIAALEAASQSD